jgi:hypothetical protein
MADKAVLAILRSNCKAENPGDEESEARAKLWTIMFREYDALAARVAELEETLRRVLGWAEAGSAALPVEKRVALNWSALEEARAILNPKKEE